MSKLKRNNKKFDIPSFVVIVIISRRFNLSSRLQKFEISTVRYIIFYTFTMCMNKSPAVRRRRIKLLRIIDINK